MTISTGHRVNKKQFFSRTRIWWYPFLMFWVVVVVEFLWFFHLFYRKTCILQGYLKFRHYHRFNLRRVASWPCSVTVRVFPARTISNQFLHFGTVSNTFLYFGRFSFTFLHFWNKSNTFLHFREIQIHSFILEEFPIHSFISKPFWIHSFIS